MKISLILVPSDKDISILLNSLKEQTIKNFELIIVDNEFSEEIQRFVNIYNKYFDINYIISSKSKTVSDKQNIGLINRKNDVIGFLNSFTVYEPTTIQCIIDSLYEKEKTINLFNANNFNLYNYNIEVTHKNINTLLLMDNYFINFKNSDIYLFDVNYETRVKDINYVLNLLEKGFNAKFISNYKITCLAPIKEDEESEYSNLLYKKIFENKRFYLMGSFIKNLFRREK